jgi:hypothetical protein
MMTMSARRALLGLGMVGLSVLLFGAHPAQPLPGRARPYFLTPTVAPYARIAPSPDWSRLDRLSGLAARTAIDARDWDFVARKLRRTAEREVGTLSAMDRYWLGSAWWAMHQPARHVRHPSWAPDTRFSPEIALAHREGGNCESSSNGHAALLNALGVPTLPVYGYHWGAREGHVWTVSDVDGRPMLADVHLTRSSGAVWRPAAKDVMAVPTADAARAFLRRRSPDNPAQAGVVMAR